MMPIHLVVLLGLGLSQVSPAQAEIYKSIDAEGHVTYSSAPTKGAKKLGLEPPPAPHTAPELGGTPPRSRSTRTPSDFPRVDSNTQKSRDQLRHKILAAELGTEEKLLAEARQSLKTSADAPEYAYDINGRPVFTARHKEKLAALQDMVTLHEKNVAALKSELANLK